MERHFHDRISDVCVCVCVCEGLKVMRIAVKLGFLKLMDLMESVSRD